MYSSFKVRLPFYYHFTKSGYYIDGKHYFFLVVVTQKEYGKTKMIREIYAKIIYIIYI